MSVRPAAVAGLFYPDDPETLASTVDDLLAASPVGDASAAPEALIAPHAGYVYSGATAALAHATLRPRADRVRRVLLLGPAHRVWLRGLAAPSSEGFATPLGVVPVDRAALECLAGLPQVSVRDDAHAAEHALEVQLPFLQRTLGEVPIVPLVVGDASSVEVAGVLAALDDAGTLVLISSDLSHYHAYEAARRLDADTAVAIESLDPDALDADSACGRVPIGGLLLEARRRGLRATRLGLCSSGDTTGPRDRVVGYGAWALARPD